MCIACAIIKLFWQRTLCATWKWRWYTTIGQMEMMVNRQKRQTRTINEMDGKIGKTKRCTNPSDWTPLTYLLFLALSARVCVCSTKCSSTRAVKTNIPCIFFVCSCRGFSFALSMPIMFYFRNFAWKRCFWKWHSDKKVYSNSLKELKNNGCH